MSKIERFASPLPLPFSRAVKAGGFLFLSGQVPVDAQGNVVKGSIQQQTEAVMQRIQETLALHGASLADVVKATVWLSDMKHFAGFNEVYAGYVEGNLPVRSTVANSTLAYDVDVEVEVQAYLG
ncbi:RidA family protein [Pseudomonas sp. F1_0610]|uniref:RidA family protein n=1 Tax=Pseudomonas sp. F1_0610 TaxID=3114284 RepID=UPI0039C3CDF4